MSDFDSDGQMAAQMKDFVTRILPELATHYRDQESLVQLEDTHNWLKTLQGNLPDLSKGREVFFADGSACINLLEKYLKLLNLRIGNESLTRRFEVPYVEFIYRYNIEMNRQSYSYMVPPTVPGTLRYMRLALRKLRLSRYDDDIESIYEAAERMCEKEAAPSDDLKLQWSAASAWDHTTKWAADGNFNLADWSKELLDAPKALQAMTNYYAVSIEQSASLTSFKDNLRSLTYFIGCPEAHQDPQRNIAQLRLFHSTQVPFLAKLQRDLQKQIDLNNRQQEIITALVFRYLIETLPPNPYNGKKSSTDRWQAYWDDMILKENSDRGKGLNGHPLQGFMDTSLVVKSSAGSSTIYPQSSQGGKGNAYRAGLALFGTLSDNIHKYKGREDGKGAYVVKEDQWGETIRSILKRLIPENFDSRTGEVDWAKERTRFVEAFSCCQCHQTSVIPTCKNSQCIFNKTRKHEHTRCVNCPNA